MSSPSATTGSDRTARARIRDAAILCFAEHGLGATTARRVASVAGVSPALVMHHFGSMAGLRGACDDHVVAVISEQKRAAMASGADFDVLAAVRESPVPGIGAYLAKVLAGDPGSVATLVDDLVGDAENYLRAGVESGLLRPSDDEHGRAVILVMWSLGALVMHEHIQRLLGVDLTDPEVRTITDLAAYAAPAYEILGRGILTEVVADRTHDALRAVTTGASHHDPDGSLPR